MCGICGVVRAHADGAVDETEFNRMRDALTHRGPDDAGTLIEPGVALGSRRLAIRDLSPRGHMPMRTPDGRYSIVYNGEVYNSLDLRRQLEARGWTFRSNSDTEVVLYAYAEHGPPVLERLNGMFAIAIWDHQERSLFLARDRLGIKPLYYTRAGDTLTFASEPKALFVAGWAARMDPACWEELMCFRYVAGERTPYEGVHRLLPGHFLLWREGRVSLTRWWNLGERAAAPGGPAPEWFRTTFDDSVTLRRISDVPVGILLSGGLDSASVAASAALQAGRGVESFTVGFTESGFDERPLAREVVSRWNLTPHEMTLASGQLSELLLDALRFNDEPFAHGHEAHIWAISRYAKPHVTVLLSGEGSDEVLGGYSRYRPLLFPRALHAAQRVIGDAGWRLAAGGPWIKLARLAGLRTIDAAVLFNACDVLPRDLAALGFPAAGVLDYRQTILDEATRVYPGAPARQAMYLDQHTFLCSLLDRNDKMTMGASIECRVPFLDYRIVEGAARLPDAVLFRRGKGKALLRAALGDRIPAALLAARKWGFGVPWPRYLRDIPALRERVIGLPRSAPVSEGPFDRRKLHDLVRRFLAGDGATEPVVRQLVAMWHEACIGGLKAHLARAV